jgi:hypothetical protein
MSLRSPTENQNGYVLQAANSRTTLSFPHASSGNPGGIRPGPPIKTFGGDDLGDLHLFTSAAIFVGGHEDHAVVLTSGPSYSSSWKIHLDGRFITNFKKLA